MAKKRYTPETIIRKLREAEVLQGQGQTIAQVIIEHWRNHYDKKRPHSALGYRPPVPEVVLPNDGKRKMETGQMAA
jgi:hypothetical protein